MPEQSVEAALSAEHCEFREQSYPDMTEAEFVSMVCNHNTALPVHKLNACVQHIPCLWGYLADTPLLYEKDRQEQMRLRCGWKRGTKYMLVLPNPDSVDADELVPLHPNSNGGSFFRGQLKQAGIEMRDVLVDYVCRFSLPVELNKYSDRHKKDGAVYLRRTIDEVKPSVLILCGAASYKALYGKNAKLDTVRGNILYYHTSDGTRIPVIPTVSHLAFLAGYANLSVFQSELVRAKHVVERVAMESTVETEYITCETVEQVKELCARIRREGTDLLAFDTEFGNDYARKEFNYTFSVQLSWAPGKAAFIKIRDQTVLPVPEVDLLSFEDFVRSVRKKVYDWMFDRTVTDPVKVGVQEKLKKAYDKYVLKAELAAEGIWGKDYHFKHQGRLWKAGVPVKGDPEYEKTVWGLLQGLLCEPRWKLVAHHLRTDIEQFHRAGAPIDHRVEDGVDTMLIHHLLYGDEDQGLDHLVRKYLPGVGAFWCDLEEWVDNNGRRRHLRFGYRNVPYDVLIPYACRDADVTYQLGRLLLEELKAQPKLDALYWRHVAPTSLHLLDVERHGILIDEEQRQALHDAYRPVYEDMLKRVREMVNWPSLNPASAQQLQSLLFSEHEYLGKKLYKWDDGTKHVLPEGVLGVGLKPLVNTAKYPKSWEELEQEGVAELHSPSAAAPVLELLAKANPDKAVIRWLRHLSVIGKFLSTYLAPIQLNEFGVPKDGKGLHNNIWADGRVRTRLSQLTQTGRYSSSEANLQTKPKRQEAAAFAALVDYYFGCSVTEYKRRTDPKYTGADLIPEKDRIHVPKFASCFVAPEGSVLIEVDFATAELCIWAYCSGDPELIRVVDAGRDMHSEVAAKAFRLPEGGQPLTDALEALEAGDFSVYEAWSAVIKKKYEALRIAAKTVNFGVMYGRGAMALAREINKIVTTPVSVDDTQQIIDGVAEAFPVAWAWINNNADSAVELEYVENAFGRRRYFQGARELSKKDQAAVRREAKNAPIQGAVGDLLAQAGYNFYRLDQAMKKRGIDLQFKVLLPVHDAFLFEVKIATLARFEPAIGMCMATRNLLPKINRGLKIDVDIFPHRWSDKGFHTAAEYFESQAA